MSITSYIFPGIPFVPALAGRDLCDRAKLRIGVLHQLAARAVGQTLREPGEKRSIVGNIALEHAADRLHERVNQLIAAELSAYVPDILERDKDVFPGCHLVAREQYLGHDLVISRLHEAFVDIFDHGVAASLRTQLATNGVLEIVKIENRYVEIAALVETIDDPVHRLTAARAHFDFSQYVGKYVAVDRGQHLFDGGFRHVVRRKRWTELVSWRSPDLPA